MYRCIESSQLYPHKIAVVDRGESVTYQQLANQSARLASLLLGTSDDLEEARVAFMVQVYGLSGGLEVWQFRYV